MGEPEVFTAHPGPPLAPPLKLNYMQVNLTWSVYVCEYYISKNITGIEILPLEIYS